MALESTASKTEIKIWQGKDSEIPVKKAEPQIIEEKKSVQKIQKDLKVSNADSKSI